MKQSTKNPVISKDDAQLITKTFASIVPVLPISMLNPEDLAERMLENENSDANSVDKLQVRSLLTNRSAVLLEKQVEGRWFNFGAPTTNLMYTPLPGNRGIQISLKNHRGEVVKCNLTDKFNKSNVHLANDIQTAMEIATLTNRNVSFHTAPDGNWSSAEWFATIYATFSNKQESK